MKRSLLIFILAPLALAEDKIRYTLFNPTPRPLMRDMSTDRPDTTESPISVDAGHFQVELSFIDWAYDDRGADRTDTLTVMPSNLKIGLLNNLDLQFVIDPYVNVHTRGQRRIDGLGDTQIRVKLNLWGNDEGSTALAVMPFIKFPTADDGLGNDKVEGGVIIPFSFAITDEIGVTTMLEIDILRDADNNDYAVGLLHTVAFGFPIWGDLGGYVEYIGNAYIDAGQTYTAAVGMGLTYGLTPDIQLDGGVNLGISEAAEDVNVFVGISFRI